MRYVCGLCKFVVSLARIDRRRVHNIVAACVFDVFVTREGCKFVGSECLVEVLSLCRKVEGLRNALAYIFGDLRSRYIEAEVQAVAQSQIEAELRLSAERIHSEEQVTNVGEQIFLFETADLHYLLVDCVDEVCVELHQEFLRSYVDHEVCVISQMIFVVFNRLDVGAVCNACARGTALFTAVQELAENAFEQSVEVEIGHRNLRSVAEDAAEVNVHGVFDEVNAEQSLLHRRAVRALCVLVELQTEFDFEVFDIDVRNKVEREERAEIVAEFVDDVEFECRSADCAIGADKSHNHIEDFAQIDNVCVACFAAAVQRYVNGHFKMCGCVLQSHVIRI